jgi:CRISPR-associated protein Cmr3
LDSTAGIELRQSLVLQKPINESWNVKHRVWPIAADALWLEDENTVFRLSPRPCSIEVSTMGIDDDDARELLWMPDVHRSKPAAAPQWWNEEDFSAWLAGSPVKVRPKSQWLWPSRRMQVHVGIRADELTANDSALFSHDVIETLERNAEWAIGFCAQFPGDLTANVATLGSDSRTARVERLPEEMFAPPPSLLNAFKEGSRGLRLVTVTATSFENGWRPDFFKSQDKEYRGRLSAIDGDLILRAAFVRRPVHISGWDMFKGQPKPISRMAASGSVYFIERVDGRKFTESDARALWLAAIGQRTHEGFGRIVAGTWNW